MSVIIFLLATAFWVGLGFFALSDTDALYDEMFLVGAFVLLLFGLLLL